MILFLIVPFLGRILYLFQVRKSTSYIYNRLCQSVGQSVGRSVTHSFDDPHVAPYWPTWPCFKVHQRTSITDCVRWSVGRSVGWSITHLFDDPDGAPFWPTWPCFIDIKTVERKKKIKRKNRE